MNRLILIALLSGLVAAGCSNGKKVEKEPTTPPELTSPAQPTPIPATPTDTVMPVAPAPTGTAVAPAPAPKAPVKSVAQAKPLAASPAKAPEAASKTYVVKKGDSLSEIAKTHKTTVKALMAINPSIKSADKIEVGEKIKLP